MPPSLSAEPLILKAPAKINLTLDVFSKRSDGYHSLASVMQAISLFDTLTFQRTDRPGIGFTCHAPEAADVPTDDTNLVVRAVKAVLAEADLSESLGLIVHLDKAIPSQAGLGGGSSDAATALKGANRLMGDRIEKKRLLELAAALGSDVPFFLIGGTAAARGRGEQLTPLEDGPELWLVVVKPLDSVSTGWAYGELDADPNRASHRATKRMEEALREGDVERIIQFQSNDFEAPVFTKHPKISWVADELRMCGAATARMSGSGAAVYGVTRTEAEAQRIAGKMQGRYPFVAVARTLRRDEA